MTALIVNCSPVRNGAAAEIVRLAEAMEIKLGGGLPLCSVESKDDVLPHRDEIIGFCRKIK